MPVQDTEIKITDKATSVARNIAASFSNMGFMLGNFGGIAGRVMPAFSSLGGSASSLGASAEIGGAGLASMAKFIPVVGAAVAVAAIAFSAFSGAAEGAEKIIRSSIGAYADMERGLANLAAVTGAAPSDVQMLSGAVDDLMMSYGGSEQEKFVGLQQALTAGAADAAEAVDLLTTANKLSVASGMDVAASTQLLTTVMASYGGSVKDASEISDTLFSLVRSGGRLSLPALSNALGTIAPTASVLGLGLKDVGAALGTLTASGRPTNKAIMELNTLLSFMGGLTDKQREGWSKLGIDVSESAIAHGGLLPIMQALGVATGGNMQQLRELIPSEKARKAALVLSTTGLEHMQKSLLDLNDVQGTTDIALGKVSDTVAFSAERWRGFKNVVQDSLGEVFAPLLKTVLGPLMGLIDAVKLLPAPLKNAIFGAVGLGLALPVVGKGIFSIGWSAIKTFVGISALTFLTITMLPQLILLGTLLIGTASAVGILAYSFKKDFGGGASDMMASLKQIMAALKFAFEFISKGEISGAMVDEWDKTEAGTKTMTFKLWALWDGLKAMFEGAKEVVIATLDGMAKGLGDSFGGIGKWIRGLMDGSMSAKDFAASIPMEDLKEFGRNVGQIASGVLWLGKAFITVGGWIGWAVGQVTDLYNWLKKVWENPFSRVLLGGAMSMTGVGLGPGLAIAATGVKEAIGGEGGFGAYPMTSLNQVVAPPSVHERAEKKQKTAVTLNLNTKHTTKIDGKDIVAAYKDKKEEHDFEGMEGDVETNLWTG